MDTLIVKSLDEERKARAQGWITDPKRAIEIAVSKKKYANVLRWFASHWQYWCTTALTIVGLIIAVHALPHSSPQVAPHESTHESR